MLGFEGYDAYGAENGLEGIAKAREVQPHLIICDIMMPVMDGYGVIEELHRDAATATIPFIFLTARTDRLDMRHGMSLGADDFLTKPFTVHELMNSIRARLQKQNEMKQQAVRRMDALRGNIILALPHELRTPLNVILGFSDLLMSDAQDMDPKRVEEMATHINRAANRLYHLTENYITYAQTELIAGDPRLFETFRSGYQLYPSYTIASYARDHVQARNRLDDFTSSLDEVTCIGLSDEYLKKITVELIDNAIKFSQPGTPIALTGRLQGDLYLLEFSDRGRGFPPEQIGNIGGFSQFERSQYEDQGSGLGLVIAKRLAELSGGSFAVHSEPGAGTVVTVGLPVRDYPES
jgi:signal transduction histidine kinase